MDPQPHRVSNQATSTEAFRRERTARNQEIGLSQLRPYARFTDAIHVDPCMPRQIWCNSSSKRFSTGLNVVLLPPKGGW